MESNQKPYQYHETKIQKYENYLILHYDNNILLYNIISKAFDNQNPEEQKSALKQLAELTDFTIPYEYFA